MKLKSLFYTIYFCLFSLLGCSPDREQNSSNTPNINSFSVTKEDGTAFSPLEYSVEIKADSILVVIPPLESRKNLKINVSYTGSSISPSNSSIIDFSNPVEFTVFDSNGKVKKYFASVKYKTPKNTMFIGGINYYYALDTQTGSTKWYFPANGSFQYSTAFFKNNVLYVGCTDNHLYALNASTGKLLWKYKTGAGIESSVFVDNDVVFFGSDDDNFYALDAISGSLKWKYKTGHNVSSSPKVSQDVVYFGSDDYYFYALNKEDGSVKWKYYAGNLFNGSGCAIVNNSLFVGNRNGNIYNLNKLSGEVIWKKNYGSSGEYSSPTISEGSLYQTDRNYLYKIDINSGNIIWQTYNPNSYYSSPYVSANSVVVNSNAGNLLVLDKSTGSIKWEKTINANGAEPILVNSTIFTGGGGSRFIYAFSENGNEVWRSSVVSISTSAPVIIDKNGGIFYPSNSGGRD